MNIILIFVAAIVYDLIVVLYMKWTVQGDAGRASGAAGILEAIKIGSVLIVVHDEDTAWGLIAGAMLGTYIGIKISTRRKPSKNGSTEQHSKQANSPYR